MKWNGTGYLKDISNGLPILLFLSSSLIKIFSVSDLMFCYYVYLYFNIHVEHQDNFKENSNMFSVISVSLTAPATSIHSASPGFSATTNVPSCVMLKDVQNLLQRVNWTEQDSSSSQGKTPRCKQLKCML